MLKKARGGFHSFLFLTLSSFLFFFFFLFDKNRLSLSDAQPIPLSASTYSVLSIGNHTQSNKDPIYVDAYFDLACSDSKDVWGTYKKLFVDYGDTVVFRFHLFPLPYHQFAFLLAKSAIAISMMHGGGAGELQELTTENVFHFFDIAFKKQEDILNSATVNMSYDEVYFTIVREWVKSIDTIDISKFELEMFGSDDAEMQTRYQFKFSTLNGVYGTPLVFVNEIIAENLDQSSLHSWSTYLSPLIEATSLTRKGKEYSHYHNHHYLQQHLHLHDDATTSSKIPRRRDVADDPISKRLEVFRLRH